MACSKGCFRDYLDKKKSRLLRAYLVGFMVSLRGCLASFYGMFKGYLDCFWIILRPFFWPILWSA